MNLDIDKIVDAALTEAFPELSFSNMSTRRTQKRVLLTQAIAKHLAKQIVEIQNEAAKPKRKYIITSKP